MNYELLKSKMDKFFKETSTEELIEKYETLGYKFVETKYKYKVNEETKPIGHMNFKSSQEVVKSHVPWYYLNKQNCKDIQIKNLEKFEVFLFKLHYERSRKSII